MHAIHQRHLGGPEVLVQEQLPDPEPGPGEVRVAVGAAGVHLLDAFLRSGSEPGFPTPDLPTVPGREVAGVVEALGPGVDPAWSGTRVVAHLGAGAGGGYASRTVVAADRLHRVPDGLDDALAVAAIGTGRTALGLLDQVSVGADDVAVVTSAAGGLGVLLVQALRRRGALVVGLAGGPWKVEVVRALGADLVVDYLEDGWDDAVRGAVAAPTLVMDGVGGDVARRVEALAADGATVVTFGWSSGDRHPFDADRLRVLEPLGPDLLARPGGLRSLEADALAAASLGSMVPVVSRYPLADASRAHADLEARRTHGKVVLVP